MFFFTLRKSSPLMCVPIIKLLRFLTQYFSIPCVFSRNIRTLANHSTVYAIDLLGFGESDKPIAFPYTMEKWAQVYANL